MGGIVFFFFFSSRRRHTRWNCDWSSDVCSSDLLPIAGGPEPRPSPGWFRKSGQRPDSVAHLSEEPGGGSGPQSMQTPIGSVTARLLWPSQGGITAPKPPAGPPAAITRRSSGESSAVYSLSPRSRTTAPLPTSAHSRRKILAAGDECGDVGFAPTRCLQVFAQLARNDDTKNGFPAPNKEPTTNQNYCLTGKAPYRFESGLLQRRVTRTSR